MIDAKLITLLKVCETGNYTRAAEKLSLTQPAVSQHIKQLEREFSTVIFERGNGKVVPTPEGKLIIEYAKRVASLYESLQQSLVDRKRAIDRLRVGVTHTSESNIVTEVLAKYTEQCSNMKITIQTNSIDNLCEMLKNYKIDIAIVAGTVTDPSIHTVMLDTDRLVLAVSNDHPLAKQDYVTVDQLRHERMILRLPSSGTRNQFSASLESKSMSLDEFNVVLEVDNIATIKDLIRRNYGVSVLARSACMDELKKGKLTALPIENLSMTREINILYHETFQHVEVLDDIVRIYDETVKTGARAGIGAVLSANAAVRELEEDDHDTDAGQR